MYLANSTTELVPLAQQDEMAATLVRLVLQLRLL